MGMVCTNCFREAGSAPDTGDLPVELVVLLCSKWLCDKCLDDLDDEELEPHNDQVQP